MTRVSATYAPSTFKDLPGWSTDDHRAAFGAFLKSCQRLIVLSRTDSKVKAEPAHLALCVKAAQLPGSKSNAEARAFFEQHFVPNRVVHEGGTRLLTAYYEPLVEGSRTPTARFPYPLYKRPPDLITVVDEANRGTGNGGFSHMRQTASGPVPFASRAEIDQGALKGLNLELLYVEHAVDAFFMQIQGSARVKLTDGSTIRIGYDGKNGHPYTSIGRVLIDQGEIPVERMSLQALQTWLKANGTKGRDVMWANRSFVFFREHADPKATDPQGVHDIMLTPGRSLAVDPSYHAIGLPIYVSAPDIRHIAPLKAPFQRLMIAQDVGSAIKGPERGDIYVGSGAKAGKIAGTTKHPGTFFVLLPRAGSQVQKPEPAPVAAIAAPSVQPPTPPTAAAAPVSVPATPNGEQAAPPPLAAATQHNPASAETIAIKAAGTPSADKANDPVEPVPPVAAQTKTGLQ
jgi:membrane-bound lytic murein transglycosylase A